MSQTICGSALEAFPSSGRVSETAKVGPSCRLAIVLGVKFFTFHVERAFR